MNLQRTIGLVIAAFIVTNGFAQDPRNPSLAELTTFMRSDLNFLDEQKNRNAHIGGSPYLDEEFREGALVYKDKVYSGLLLRYDYYEGHFEFMTEEAIKFLDPRFTEVDTVWMGNDTYIYTEYQDVLSEKMSYMQVLHDGKSQLLSYREVILLQPESNSGYEEAKPARFQPRPERFFVKIDGSVAKEFRNKKSIEAVFGEKAGLLEEYAKKEKLKFKDSKEIIQLCSYFDSLN